ANADSIERFDVTAKKMGCDYNSWQKVKTVSLRFDNFKRLLDTFEPEIVLLEHWELSEEWFHKDMKYSVDKYIDEFLEYYEVENTNCKVFWFPHPRGHRGMGI